VNRTPSGIAGSRPFFTCRRRIELPLSPIADKFVQSKQEADIRIAIRRPSATDRGPLAPPASAPLPDNPRILLIWLEKAELARSSL
jgi:hypothetical protein